jgi:catechol 2,3-dioxygenase-like lactoylglutathione lyase family enzyme
MRVRGILWTGVRVTDQKAAEAFFSDVLGLTLARKDDAQQFSLFQLPSGQEFEVFGPGSSWSAIHEHPVVVGFEVEDVSESRAELEGHGVEFVTDIQGDPQTGEWCYFRGPDGILFEICSKGSGAAAVVFQAIYGTGQAGEPLTPEALLTDVELSISPR